MLQYSHDENNKRQSRKGLEVKQVNAIKENET